MESDVARIAVYIAASTVLMAAAIVFAGRVNGGSGPRWAPAFGAAFAVSSVGILVAKYGANAGLPWQVYYTLPMLVTVLLPPLVFRFSWRRAVLYVALAFALAPLIHAVFFYALGWGDYMPFLHLPPL